MKKLQIIKVEFIQLMIMYKPKIIIHTYKTILYITLINKN